ncbi:hypothetical protein FHR81_001746 [Actinoalloteichus hoggarensis]|uniref:hypothetical protein n=1 Tax=Actinoalloteichus hoggarensis TaxID=1470176 RepID=UPI0012FDF066|nr:hypothetical protein [Actinoalloteichus hoggarensis]MBB5920708.1 hypothetical protein [Actinoalloteichus hoggarensis]
MNGRCAPGVGMTRVSRQRGQAGRRRVRRAGDAGTGVDGVVRRMVERRGRRAGDGDAAGGRVLGASAGDDTNWIDSASGSGTGAAAVAQAASGAIAAVVADVEPGAIGGTAGRASTTASGGACDRVRGVGAEIDGGGSGRRGSGRTVSPSGTVLGERGSE